MDDYRYCEICYDALNEDWKYTRCEDCRRTDYAVSERDYEEMERLGELDYERFDGLV